MRRRRTDRLLSHPLTLALALTGLGAAAHAQPTSPVLPATPTPPAASPAVPRERLIPLEVNVNNAPGGSWTLLERDGVLYAPAEAFEEWRLARRPDSPPIQHRGQTWYSLGSLPGFQSRINLANLSVDLVFSPTAFAQTRVAEHEPEKQKHAVAAEPALFLNYDTNFSYTKPRDARADRDLGLLGEIGFSNRLGVFTTSFVARHLDGANPSAPRSFNRLESTFTRDWPQQGLTLRAGDATTRAGVLGRPIYFGGLQLGRNFGLTPGFITQPIPVISGSSSAPSTVELYVNDALRQTSRVPTGPFVIDNFPLLTGAGQARLVVRDVLGRETVIVQPFFTHSNLLEQGLSDWSVEAGWTRHDLGSENDGYGQPFLSGIWRRGITKGFTVEAQGQLGKDTRTLGGGVMYTLPWQMLGIGALSVSNDRTRGNGAQWLAGLEHNSLRHGFSLHLRGATRRYAELGLEPGFLPNRRELSASYSYSDDKFGSLGIGYARIDSYDRGPIVTYTANYSRRIGERAAITFSLTHVDGTGGGTSVGVNLQVPLENHVNVSAALTHRSQQTDAYVSASKGIAADTGLGWRVLGGARDATPYTEGGLYWQGGKVLLTGDASVSKQQQALRLGAQGGLVFMDGELFAARRLDSSFALVEVPGYADVGIGVHGRLLTRTDSKGRALVPRLLPYQANSIRLDPTELPISAELDTIEQIVVPPARSGVKVVFPVRSGRGALIKIVFDDGEPAPAGAEIELLGDKQEFFVARRGEAFVTGLQPKNELRLKWRGASCGFTVELPKGEIDEIARVGPLRCTGVQR